MDFAEDGILAKYQPHQYLDSLANGKIDPKKLLQDLIDTNFIDKNLKIHDWWDYVGRYLTAKYKTSNPKKLKKIEKLYKSAKSLPKVALKSPHLTIPNQPNQPNHISSQIENLLKFFSISLQTKIEEYLRKVALKNKTKVLTLGRKKTLLLELSNSRETCNDDGIFLEAVEGAIKYEACNIGYIDAIIKNKKIKC